MIALNMHSCFAFIGLAIKLGAKMSKILFYILSKNINE